MHLPWTPKRIAAEAVRLNRLVDGDWVTITAHSVYGQERWIVRLERAIGDNLTLGTDYALNTAIEHARACIKEGKALEAANTGSVVHDFKGEKRCPACGFEGIRLRPTITYKPGWEFSWDSDFLRIHVGAPDPMATCATTGEPRPVDYALHLPESGFDGAWLLNRIHGIEYHEACEWLRVDGALVDDPHRGQETFTADELALGCPLAKDEGQEGGSADDNA